MATLSVHRIWRRLVGTLGGEQRRFRRAMARQRSKAELADALLATLSPQALFMAGYPAHRRAQAYHRHVTYVRLRQTPLVSLDRARHP
jgi:hypothetical protein